MKITYSITKEDFWNYSKYVRFKSPRFKISLVFAILSWLMAPTGMFILFKSIKISLLTVMPIIIIHLVYLYPLAKYAAFKYIDSDKNALSEQTVYITPEGVSKSTNFQQIFSKWYIVNKIEMTTNYILIYSNPVTAIIIPKRIFNTEDEALKFYDTANNYLKDSRK